MTLNQLEGIMADYYKCSDCGWKGTVGEAMRPDKEVAEDWKKIWELRKSMEPKTYLLADEQGVRSQEFPGAFSWKKEIQQTLVCPKCAGEAAQVTNEETGPEEL